MELYEKHPNITYDITVKTDEEIRKLKEKDPQGKSLKQYNIIDQAGSRRKSKLNDISARYVLDNAHPDAYVVNRCFSAEVLADWSLTTDGVASSGETLVKYPFLLPVATFHMPFLATLQSPPSFLPPAFFLFPFLTTSHTTLLLLYTSDS